MKDTYSFILAAILLLAYLKFGFKYVELSGKRNEPDFETKYGNYYRSVRLYTWIIIILFVLLALVMTFIIPE